MRGGFDNPIVTRSLRTRLRGTRAMFIPGAYFTVMIVVLFVLFYIHDMGDLKSEVAMEVFFWIAFTCNFLVMVFVTAVNTANYFAQEKSQKTLDFLRISRLTPYGIIIGHLLGGLTLPLVLAAVTMPLVAMSASWGGFPIGVLIKVAILLIVYALIASAFALVVALTVKRASLAGGTVALPLVGFVIVGFVMQAGAIRFFPWPLSTVAFVAPTMFIVPLMSPGMLGTPLPDILFFGDHPVDAFVFNMGMLVGLAALLVVGVARKVERLSKAFLSHLQATVVAVVLLGLLSGIYASIIRESISGVPRATFHRSELPFAMMIYASAALAIVAAFLIVTTPTRERVLRGRLPTGRGSLPWDHESRPAAIHTAALAILGAATLGFFTMQSSDLGPQAGLSPAIAFLVLVFFYAALTLELKLAFPRSYKAWVAVLAFLFWVALPGGAGVMDEFDITRPFSWPLLLGSPSNMLATSLSASDPRAIGPSIYRDLAVFMGAIVLHLVAGFIMMGHVRKLRREIPGEFERLVAAANAPPTEGATA